MLPPELFNCSNYKLFLTKLRFDFSWCPITIPSEVKSTEWGIDVQRCFEYDIPRMNTFALSSLSPRRWGQIAKFTSGNEIYP